MCCSAKFAVWCGSCMVTRRLWGGKLSGGAVGILLVLAGLVGVIAGSFLVRVPAPVSVSGSISPTEAPVARVETVDKQNASLVVVVTPEVKVMTHKTGILTGAVCAPGDVWTSGQSVFSINEEPLVFLATARPLWRDLTVGDRGPDVKALQNELNRLGYAVSADGVVGQRTVNAARALARSAGSVTAASWGSIPVKSFVWFPASPVTVAKCTTATGTHLSAANPLAMLPTALTSAKVKELPSGLIPGDRVLKLDEVTIPVDAQGRVSSPEDLAKLSQSPAYLEYTANQTSNPGANSLTGESAQDATTGSGTAGAGMSIIFQLAQPLTVYSLPAAAVYSVSDTKGCVLSHGVGVPVTITSSQLGQTFIIPDREDVTLDTVTLRPPKGLPCR